MIRTGWLIRAPRPVPYARAYQAMHRMADLRAAGQVPDTLVLLEHPPVYTAGRRTTPAHFLASTREIEASRAEIFDVDRGGSVTFHGPGQLVGYPIVDLGPRPDAVAHLRHIEEAMILAARDIGVVVGRDPEQTGVWAGNRKVCAIGVRVARARVTLHGFALNCDTDLQWFDAIVPCGLTGRGVTSLSELAASTVTVDDMAPVVTARFEGVFGLRLEPAPSWAGGLFLPPPERAAAAG